MVWTDFVTLALITIILTLLVQYRALLMFLCAALGVGAGIYRGKNPVRKDKK